MTSLFSLVIFETTSRLEILDALTCLEDKTAIIIPFVKKIRLALILSITITFIPEIFNCWNKVSLAAAARTPIGKNGKRKKTLSIFKLLKERINSFYFLTRKKFLYARHRNRIAPYKALNKFTTEMI